VQADDPNLLLIRRYRSTDQDAVCALHQAALKAVGAYAKGPQGSLLNADLNDIEGVYLNRRGEFLVGSLRNRIVAMGALKCLSSQVAEITRMRVHPDYWRRGYGEAILHRLETAAANLGYAELWLDTLLVQTAAQRLYRKNGFEEVLRFYVRGYDADEAILLRKARPTMQIG
jgi:ribosomal protein S18 acetylase RimI-like enzyme